MANTTNFGWETPDDTDLVKDGASAMRTLGNAIDASFVDLKGGTTGQVLAKASNTDLDFTWSSVDPLTILDAKGDLISATAADTPARLAVGTNGQVLAANSATSTGLEWQTISSGGMTLLSTTTLTGQNVAVTGISQDYTDLIINIYGIQPSANAYPILQFRNSTTAQKVYYGGWEYTAFTGTFANEDNFYPTATFSYGAGVTENNIQIRITNYTTTTANRRLIDAKGAYTYTNAEIHAVASAGFITGTSAINAVYIDLSSTNTFSAGTMQIWGVK